MMPMNDDDVNLRVIQADSQSHAWPMATLDGPDWKMNDCTDIKSIKSTTISMYWLSNLRYKWISLTDGILWQPISMMDRRKQPWPRT